jgi:hypothetical protein
VVSRSIGVLVLLLVLISTLPTVRSKGCHHTTANEGGSVQANTKQKICDPLRPTLTSTKRKIVRKKRFKQHSKIDSKIPPGVSCFVATSKILFHETNNRRGGRGAQRR